MSLHLERKKGQAIIFEIENIKKIEVTFTDYDMNSGKGYFLIKAPKEIHIVRKELFNKER